MKGVVLAAGNGSRLFPSTKAMSKPLLSVFDKPMIYYPITTLLQLGITEIAIVCSEYNIHYYRELFCNISRLGVILSFEVQKEPKGIAHALLSVEEFVDRKSFALILGDNIFSGVELDRLLVEADESYLSGALIFGYRMKDASEYGVVEFKQGDQLKIKRIVEKPKNPSSDVVVTGLYFYDYQALDLVRKLKPSKRGELEITDLNNLYLKQSELNLKIFSNNCVWFDSGTPQCLYKASSYIQLMEEMHDIKIGCIELEALKQGMITKDKLNEIIEEYPVSPYKEFLIKAII